MLPLYHNAPILVYAVQGRGIYGLMISGCPETFESSQQTEQQSQEERRQRFRDRHQKFEEFREGDIVAIPEGAAHWAYNDVLLLAGNLEGDKSNSKEAGGASLNLAMSSEARRLQGLHDKRGHIVIVEHGLHVIRPPFRRREYGREEEKGYYGGDNGLEETVCNAKIRENLDKPSRTDVYIPRAGRFSSLHRQ
ncbi:Glutelin type-A 1 [Sesamum angolense]|uniref:Glutelin type-A 1 n=1 Tax=Sesamum angolense TaxID=2727404 RepID=A0AAE1X8H9_9LAMI|nr:Glutelin type-A 1 [Sesamum angolense]